MFGFLLNLIFQRKTQKNDLRFSFAASRCCLFVKINFFVSCVCLHNKNQKVFSRNVKKKLKKRFFACVTFGLSQQKTLHPTNVAKEICSLPAPMACLQHPDGRNLSEIAQVEETKGEECSVVSFGEFLL